MLSNPFEPVLNGTMQKMGAKDEKERGTEEGWKNCDQKLFYKSMHTLFYVQKTHFRSNKVSFIQIAEEIRCVFDDI